MFERERTTLGRSLGSLAVGIEHVGSTAIPGLAAKPIIDLMIGVQSLTEARSRCVEPLEALGYAYIRDYESWLPGELFFRKGIPGPWTLHVHLMEPSNPRWDAFLLFRDYLRAHPDAASTYGNLKKSLAVAFEADIAGYRKAKHGFVDAAIAKARAEQRSAT